MKIEIYRSPVTEDPIRATVNGLGDVPGATFVASQHWGAGTYDACVVEAENDPHLVGETVYRLSAEWLDGGEP